MTTFAVYPQTQFVNAQPYVLVRPFDASICEAHQLARPCLLILCASMSIHYMMGHLAILHPILWIDAFSLFEMSDPSECTVALFFPFEQVNFVPGSIRPCSNNIENGMRTSSRFPVICNEAMSPVSIASMRFCACLI